MKCLQHLFLLTAFTQLSCATDSISEISWHESLPPEVVKPRRYEVETTIQNLHTEFNKEQILASAQASLKPKIDAICPKGSKLFDSVVTERKIDPNTFNRWVQAKLVIQCIEPSYEAYQAAISSPLSPSKNGVTDNAKVLEEEKLLTELSQKCRMVPQKSEYADHCSNALKILETYSGPGANSFRTRARIGLCIAAQKDQGIAAIKKNCSEALSVASQTRTPETSF
jgi:hypothetical protein